MKNFLRAFTLTRQSARIVLWIYGTNALLSLLILLPAYATLGAGAGHSMAFTRLLDGFDYTVYSDFMAKSGVAVDALLSVGRWLSILWLVLNVFLAGGILLRFAQPGEPIRASTFLAGCAQYFSRFAGLLGVVMLFSGLLFFIVLLVGTLAGAALYNTVTEQELFYVGIVTLIVGVLVGALVFCIGDYAKVLQFRQDDHNPFRAFGRAGRFVLAHPGQTFGPYLLLIAIGTASFGLYFLIDDLIGMHNWPTIIILFVVQQGLIAARIFLKVWSLGTAYTVSTALIPPTTRQTAIFVDPSPEPMAPTEPVEPPTNPTVHSPGE